MRGRHARMLLPGVQAILGFQLVAVTNQRFELLTAHEQLLFLGAFVLLAVAMGLIMAPAAYHRQVERGAHERHPERLVVPGHLRLFPRLVHAVDGEPDTGVPAE